MSDRSAAIFYRTAMTIAAIWAAERLIEPAADAVASLNIAVAARAVGATLASLATAYALRQLAAQPALAAGSQQSAPPGLRKAIHGRRRERSAGPLAFVILAAALTGYIAFATFLINQAIYLTVLGSALYLADVIVQDGTEALLKPEAPVGGMGPHDGRPAPQRARPDRRHPARRRAARGAGRRDRGGSRAVGRAVAGHVRRPASRLFRLLRRRRHLVAVVDDQRGGGVRRRGFRHPAHPALAWRAAPAQYAPRRRRQQLGQHDLRLCRRDRRRLARRRANRRRRPEARPDRRRAYRSASASACKRSPTISSPASSCCGSAASASATGWWWETSRVSCAASTPAPPRSRPSIAAA